MAGEGAKLSGLAKAAHGQAIRSDVEAIIPADARRILDVGCAAGNLGSALKQRGEVEVVGVEMSLELAAAAGGRLDRVYAGTIEETMPDLPDGYFDCIVFADVLEHTINPHQVLWDVRSKLAPGGVVVASIPNVRHYSVLRELVWRGRWDYAETGLLDSGHLRFFTLGTILDMFRWAGYETELAAVNRKMSRLVWRLNRLSGGRLWPFMDYQYLLIAHAVPGASPPAAPWWTGSSL